MQQLIKIMLYVLQNAIERAQHEGCSSVSKRLGGRSGVSGDNGGGVRYDIRESVA